LNNGVVTGVFSHTNIYVENEILLIDEIDFMTITKEILLNFGAELDRGVYRLEKMKGYFNLINLKGNLFYEYNIHQVQMCKIQYVHQLQNLYYVLTGNELKLNQDERN
jgi:hypothetical protein